MSLFEFIIIVSLFSFLIIKDFWHERRLDKLLNRLMSRNYAEFRYYQDKWEKDVKDIEHLREETRKGSEENKGDKTVDLRKFFNPDEFEEDWKEEE